VVEAIDSNDYRLRVTQIVGCPNGCRAMAACSAGKPVGGSGGLQAGYVITTASSCLTHTGVDSMNLPEGLFHPPAICGLALACAALGLPPANAQGNGGFQF